MARIKFNDCAQDCLTVDFMLDYKPRQLWISGSFRHKKWVKNTHVVGLTHFASCPKKAPLTTHEVIPLQLLYISDKGRYG